MKPAELGQKSFERVDIAHLASDVANKIDFNGNYNGKVEADDFADLFDKASKAAPASYENVASAEAAVEKAAKKEEKSAPTSEGTKLAILLLGLIIWPLLLVWLFIKDDKETPKHQRDVADLNSRRAEHERAIAQLVTDLGPSLKEPPLAIDRVSSMMWEATRPKSDPAGILFAFYTLGLSAMFAPKSVIPGGAGGIDPDEATLLVNGARSLPERERRALAATLEAGLDGGAIYTMGYSNEEKAASHDTLAAFIKDNPPLQIDTAAAHLALVSNVVRFVGADSIRTLRLGLDQLHFGHRDVSLTMAQVDAFKAALVAADPVQREKMIAMVKKDVPGMIGRTERSWPERSTPALDELKKIIDP